MGLNNCLFSMSCGNKVFTGDCRAAVSLNLCLMNLTTFGYSCNLTSNVRDGSAWLPTFKEPESKFGHSEFPFTSILPSLLMRLTSVVTALILQVGNGARHFCDWIHMTRFISNTGLAVMTSLPPSISSVYFVHLFTWMYHVR